MGANSEKIVSFFVAQFYLNLVFGVDARYKDLTLVAAHSAIMDSFGDADIKDVSMERICRKLRIVERACRYLAFIFLVG